MKLNLNKQDADKLRREIGLITGDEAAAVLNCDRVDVYRQVALGTLKFNRDARGALLIATADLHGYASRGCPGLNDTPRIVDGWLFADRTMDRHTFLRGVAGNRRFYANFHAFAVQELRTHAGQLMRRGAVGKLSHTMTTVEKFYGGGPEAFNATVAKCQQHIANLRVASGGSELALRCVSPTFTTDLRKAVKEAF